MPWQLAVSLRYLFSRRHRAFVSFITILSLLGVAVGVMTLMTVISVMNGFEINLRERILGMNADIRFERPGGIHREDVLQDRLGVYPHVRSVAPYIRGQVMIRADDRVSGVVMKGIDAKQEGEVSRLAQYIQRGDFVFDASFEKPGVILGTELAKVLGVDVGDVVDIISPVFQKNVLGQDVPLTEPFFVQALFQSGMYDYDATMIFISLEAAQRLLDIGDLISGYAIRLEDSSLARQTRQAIQKDFAHPYWVRDWMDLNENLFSALKLEKTVMFLILVLIVLVAAFNITSALIMIVMEKTRDIGILRALGATSRDILLIFSLKGLVIGILGTMAGGLCGFGLVEILETKNAIHLPSDIYYIDALPVDMRANDVVVIMLSALGLCVLASLYPAWKAATLKPIEALRYE